MESQDRTRDVVDSLLDISVGAKFMVSASPSFQVVSEFLFRVCNGGSVIWDEKDKFTLNGFLGSDGNMRHRPIQCSWTPKSISVSRNFDYELALVLSVALPTLVGDEKVEEKERHFLVKIYICAKSNGHSVGTGWGEVFEVYQ